MKKIKRRLICLLLCVCMCSSLFVYAGAIEPLDGTIDADDNATLIKPTLEVSNVPQGAVAVGYDMLTSDIYYYHVDADILSLNPNVSTFIEPGWMPDIENAVSPNNIIGDSDDREMVDAASMSQNPHRAIALVQAQYFDHDWVAYGTATMISPNVAITAAHCLKHPDYGWPDSVTVFPGIYGSVSSPVQPFGSSFAREIVVSAPFDGIEAQYHDWGLIRLSSNLGNSSGFLGLEYSEESLVTGDADPYSLISGYPGDRNGHNGSPNASFQYFNQYCAFDLITDERSALTRYNGTTYLYKLLEHSIDATDGQSGSAVLYPRLTTAGGFVVQGIYIGGLNSSANAALAFTSQTYSFIIAYKNNS